MVLSARSPYFAALLEPHTEESRKNSLVLREDDVDFEVLHGCFGFRVDGVGLGCTDGRGGVEAVYLINSIFSLLH